MSVQSLNYGFWAQWTNPQKVTFDGPNRRMLVNSGVESLDVEVDLYSDWKEWVTVEDHGKYLPAMRAVGGDPTTGGRALGATFFLTNGWRVRTWEGDHRLVVNGNLFTEEGDPPFVPVEGPYTTIIESNVSSLVDRLSRLEEIPTQDWTEAEFDSLAASISTLGSPPTALEIAQEVWSAPEGLRMLLAAKILQNKTVTDPTTSLMTVYDDDNTTPLLTAAIFEDAESLQPYRGRGVDARDRLAE